MLVDPPGPSTSLPIPPTTAEPLPPFWLGENQVDWETARQECETQGGHLADVEDADEWNEIIAFINGE